MNALEDSKYQGMRKDLAVAGEAVFEVSLGT